MCVHVLVIGTLTYIHGNVHVLSNSVMLTHRSDCHVLVRGSLLLGVAYIMTLRVVTCGRRGARRVRERPGGAAGRARTLQLHPAQQPGGGAHTSQPRPMVSQRRPYVTATTHGEWCLIVTATTPGKSVPVVFNPF